jgi:hypothetical protein
MTTLKVVCVNDTNRPDGIPATKWVKKGEIYTVIEIAKMVIQGGFLGFKLQEINIDDCVPYQYFASYRFVPLELVNDRWAQETLDKILEEAIKEEEKSYLNN